MKHHSFTEVWHKCLTSVFLILLSVSSPLFANAYSASSEFLHIYTDSSGTSFLWNTNLNQNLTLEDFSFGLDANYIDSYSSLENIKFKLNHFNLVTSFSTPIIDSKIKIFYSQADNFLIRINGDNYKLEKINSLDFYFSLPVKLHNLIPNINTNLVIEPFVFFGDLDTTNGNFHYFYANLKSPILWSAGAKIQIEKLNLCGYYISANADFYSYPLTENDNSLDKFIQTKNWLLGFSSNYYIPLNDFSLEPALGFFHLTINANGSLTSSNQKYFLFPYKFFNLTGNAKLDAITLGLNAKYKKDFFILTSNFEAIFCVNQTLDYIANYLYKKNFIFDGSEGTLSGNINRLQGNGIGLLTFAADFNIPIKKSTMALNVQKTFFIPLLFNKENLFPSDGDDGSDSSVSSFDDKFLLHYLLSGISVSAKIKF